MTSMAERYDHVKALVPVLQQIVDGSRDLALASTGGLLFADAVEVQLLLEGLGHQGEE